MSGTKPANGGAWLLGGAGLALGLLVGHMIGVGSVPAPNPQERNLDASLWLQTSGEYRALCLQTYRFAGERLRRKVEEKPKVGLPPAVVMDLDETVFDNSPFQAWLYNNGQVFSPPLWAVWEEHHPDEVALVPGAAGFIESAERAGVAVFYVSNRQEKYRSSAVRALVKNGLITKDIERRLLLMSGSGDKSARRDQVARSHRVLLTVGDNLLDFSEEFKAPRVGPDDLHGQEKALATRLRQVDARREHFGDDWIILPNPVYGEWTRLIGRRPGRNLRTTTFKGLPAGPAARPGE